MGQMKYRQDGYFFGKVSYRRDSKGSEKKSEVKKEWEGKNRRNRQYVITKKFIINLVFVLHQNSLKSNMNNIRHCTTWPLLP